jgi:formate dehydrogenase subunit gamma
MTRYIQRHSLLKRWIHGITMVACLSLIASGLVVFIPAVGRAVGSNVVQFVRMGHRVFALAFIGAPLAGLILAPKGFIHMVKNLTAPWDEDDKKFMLLFPKYMFAPKTTHMPKQHEVKSGQRLSDATLILVAVMIAVTGVVLWAGAYVSPVVFRTALLLHDISFALISIIMCVHIYLGAGIFQPYRGLARLMFGNGRVTEEEARYHWGHWADEELASGKNVVMVPDLAPQKGE